jgi:hypothetical protein
LGGSNRIEIGAKAIFFAACCSMYLVKDFTTASFY